MERPKFDYEAIGFKASDRDKMVASAVEIPAGMDGISRNTPVAEIMAAADIADGFNDSRDPVRKWFARIMFALIAIPLFLGIAGSVALNAIALFR